MSTWWATAAVVAGAISSTPSNLQPSISPNEPLAAVGVGAGPCSKFTQIDKLDPKWARDTFMSWAQGFMAGSNNERSAHDSVNVNAISEDAQWANLEAYCSDHPNEPFVLGVMVLYLSLEKKLPTQ